jgi:glycosyltransferase involved in cell wall biosynthesis
MSKKRVLVVPSDRTGVSYFRSTKPHITLETMFPDEFHVDIDYEPKVNDDKWLSQYDLIHYHRSFGSYDGHEELIKRCKAMGIPTFMDIDDHWAPGPHHPAYQIIKKNEIDKKILNNLRTAENIITTTPIFADTIKSATKNENVFVLPNAIDPTEKQFTPNPEKSDRIRIGWLGGSSHMKDLELLRGIVSSMKNDGLLDKVQFVLCGFDLRGTVTMIDQKTGKQTQRPIKPTESVWYKYEQIFTNNYDSVSKKYKDFLLSFKKGEYSDVANESYRRVWTKPISSYASNYNLFDISLAPIEDNTFNKNKSQLKVIEAGFHKKALIAQDFGPYQIDLTNAYVKAEKKGEQPKFDETANAYMVNSSRNHKQWYQYIKKLVTNPEQIEILKTNLHNTVKDTYSIESVTRNRRNLYLNAIEKAKKETKVANNVAN